MKGVILGLCPDARLVDLSHDIAPFDVDAAGFAVAQAVPWFPPGTIHLMVIDPGVGTDRRGLVVRGERACYVAPDNGMLGPLLTQDTPQAVHHIVPTERIAPARSNTFHGRDLFAPAAALLALGTPIGQLGPAVDLSTLRGFPPPTVTAPQVIQVDRFGNLITNVTPDQLTGVDAIGINGHTLPLVRCYGEIAPGRMGALIGSADRLELFVREGNAAEALQAGRGTRITVPPP